MDNPISLLTSLCMALALGGLIGMEREMHYQAKKLNTHSLPGGLRTNAMMAVLGCLSMILGLQVESTAFVLMIFAAVTLFALISHTYFVFHKGLAGVTSELAGVASFLIGMLVALEQTYLAVLASVIITALLALKKWLHQVAHNLQKKELIAILKFLIISFVVLQVMPLDWYDPWGFFNWRPKVVWLMVVFVAAIRFIGYFLSKFISTEKSIVLSGIVGGLVSSTAVTTGISLESRGKKFSSAFLMGILIAAGIMFFRVIFEISFLSTDLLRIMLWPLVVMGIASVVIGLLAPLVVKEKKHSLESDLEIEQPFELKSALLFGAFFLTIIFIAEKIQTLPFFAESGLFVTAAIAGLTDVDAITLAMANLARSGEIELTLASQVIFLAVIVNTGVKAGIVFFFGSRKLFTAILSSLLIVMGLGIVTLFIAT